MNTQDIKKLLVNGLFFNVEQQKRVKVEIKLLIFVITLISHNIYAQYDSKDENRIIDTSDQIIVLYNLAKKNFENKEFKKSLKLLKALSRRDDLGS